MGPLHRTGSDCFSDAYFIAINCSRIDGAISSRDGGSDHFCRFLIWHLPDAEAKLGNYVAVIEANSWLARHVMVGSVLFLLSFFRIAFSRGSIIGSFYTQSLEVICSISRSGELSFAVNSFSNAFWAGFCSLFVQQPALFAVYSFSKMRSCSA